MNDNWLTLYLYTVTEESFERYDLIKALLFIAIVAIINVCKGKLRHRELFSWLVSFRRG